MLAELGLRLVHQNKFEELEKKVKSQEAKIKELEAKLAKCQGSGEPAASATEKSAGEDSSDNTAKDGGSSKPGGYLASLQGITQEDIATKYDVYSDEELDVDLLGKA